VNRRRRNLLSYALNVGVIAAFAVLLAFALVRLGEIGRDMRIDATENMLWVIYQAHAASLRLDSDAARMAQGTDDVDLAIRHDVLLSRLNLMQEGPQIRFIERLGLADAFAEALASADQLEVLVDEMAPGADDTATDIQATLAPLNAFAGRAANAAMVAEWDALGGRLDEHRNTVWQIIASVLGILVAGGLLSARLVLSLRQTRRTEDSLRREMEFSQRLTASSGEGILTVDPHLNCSSWNRAMERLFGVTAGECVGQPIGLAAPLFAEPRIEASLRRSLAGEEFHVDTRTIRLPHGDKEEVSLGLACFPLRSDGEIVGAIAFVRDRTERHAQPHGASHRDRLEQLVRDRTGDLEHAQRQLVSAIDTAPDGFAAFDADGRLVLANRKLRDLLPVEDHAVDTDATVSDILRSSQRFTGILDTDPEPEGDVLRELQLPDGRWVQMTVKPMPDGGSVMRLADVTGYKDTARELEFALEREREVGESYRDFASMVSHQFRTPLAVIDSSMQRLVRRGAKATVEEIAERAGKVRQAISRLANLVDGTLDAARLETGQIEVKARDCALPALVESVCERQREAAPHRDLRLNVADGGGVPTAVAHCDPALIEHVMNNLLSNAEKYSPPEAPIEVRVSTDEQAVYCSVRDQGVGIPSDELSQVFQPFIRATTAKGTPGTGIGLHLARNLARLQGGEVTVETQEGRGSTFTLRLPRSRTASQYEPAA
jgi:PAS domain S-box-containing protein